MHRTKSLQPQGSIASAIVAMGALLVVACSSSSNGGSGSSDDVVNSCDAQCDAQTAAKNCGTGGLSNADCKTLCSFIVPGLSADCRAKAKASYDCGAQQTWSCSAGSNLPQMDDRAACQAQVTAYAPCFQSGDAGGGGG
jgi:hypothetical protein